MYGSKVTQQTLGTFFDHGEKMFKRLALLQIGIGDITPLNLPV